MSAGQGVGRSSGGYFGTWMKVTAVTVVFAVLAMVVGQVIWPPAEGGTEPTPGQVASFVVVAALTAVTFGLGMSFLIFGFTAVREVAGDSKYRAWAMYLSIGWLLVSWWPHGSLHAFIGDNIQQLLYIEFGFHVTSYFAGIVLAAGFLALIRERRREAASAR